MTEVDITTFRVNVYYGVHCREFLIESSYNYYTQCKLTDDRKTGLCYMKLTVL